MICVEDDRLVAAAGQIVVAADTKEPRASIGPSIPARDATVRRPCHHGAHAHWPAGLSILLVSDSDSTLVRRILDTGTQIVGASAGAYLGLLTGLGPTGTAVSGAAFGPVITQGLVELGRRVLGPRQEARVGATAFYIADRIQHRLDAGEPLRDDGFFGADGGDRTAADEVLEGVLIKAGEAYEEKKIRWLSNLFASVAFDASISPSRANHLVSLAGDLNYRQLVLISIIGQQHKDGPLLRNANARGDAGLGIRRNDEAMAILTEMYDLVQRGIAHQMSEIWMVGPDMGKPGDVRLNHSGAMLYNLMELGMMDRAEWLEVVRVLPPESPVETRIDRP